MRTAGECPRCDGSGWLRSGRQRVVCTRWDCPARPASARREWFDPSAEAHQPRPTITEEKQ